MFEVCFQFSVFNLPHIFPFSFSIQFLMSELDPDSMGVILYHKFIETLFTPDQSYSPPDTFLIHHYNGLESSCPGNKVRLTPYTL